MESKDFVKYYSKSMSLTEISEIEDYKLREIKYRYHTLRHKVFINEKKYSDKEWVKQTNYLREQEKLELEKHLLG